MDFQNGQFRKLKALGNFNFGPLNGITIAGGTEMQFDGTILKLNGADHPCPQFALAIKAGFVVPVEDQTSTFQTQAAKVEVKSATSQGETRDAVNMGTAVEEEQVVGSVAQAASKRAEAAPKASEIQKDPTPTPTPTPAPQTVRNLSVEEADAQNSRAIQEALSKPVKKGYVGGNLVNSVDDEDTPARTVGGGKFKLQASDGASQGVVIGKVRSGANSAKVGPGATKSEFTDITKVTPDAVERGLQAQAGTVEGIRGLEAKSAAVEPGIQNTGAKVFSTEEAIKHNPPKPMKSTTVITDGEDIRTVVGGVTGDVQEAASGDELQQLLPDAAVAKPPRKGAVVDLDPPKAESDGSVLGQAAADALNQGDTPWAASEDEVADIVASWDKKRHWQKRVAEAVGMYADWPEALDAICEIEADSVVKHIKSRLAKKAAEAAG